MVIKSWKNVGKITSVTPKKGHCNMLSPMCLKAHTQMKTLFATFGGIVLWPLNDMFIPTFDGSIKNVAIETLNPLVEKKYVFTSQVKGHKFLPYL